MNNSRGYRKLALALAFTILAGAFTRVPETAYAATPLALTPRLSPDVMQPGSGSTPTWRTIDYASDADTKQAVFNWNISPAQTPYYYELSYPIAKDREVTVLVSKASTNAVVELSYTVTSGGVPVVDPDFKVYNGSSGPIDPSAFPAYADNYKITTAPGVQTFSMSNTTNSNGFSFMYDSRVVHFIWTGGVFYYATDGIESGIVYDFSLKSGEKNPDGSWKDPYVSNAPIYVAPKPTFTAIDANGRTINDLITLDVERGQELDMGLIPGATPQEMRLSFKAPTRWDATALDFVKPLDSTSHMSLTITMPHSSNETPKTIEFTIDNLNAASLSIGSDYQVPQTGKKPEIARNGGDIIITLSGLDAGQVYSARVQPVTAPAGIASRWSQVSNIHTLLKYTITGIGNRHYIKLWPYSGIAGSYTLATTMGDIDYNDPEQMGAIQLSTGFEEYILVPTTLLTRRYYGIVFQPQGAGAPMYSQKLLTIISSGALAPEAPTEFSVESSVMTRKPYYFTGTEADLALEVYWDLGAAEVLNELISESALAVNITYDLGRSPSPTGSSTSFAAITVELDETASGFSADFSFVTPGGITPVTGEITIKDNLQTGRRHYYARTELMFDAVASGIPAQGPTFAFPGIYYVNIALTDVDGRSYTMTPTPYDSFTLSSLTMPELPPPQNTRLTAKDTVIGASGDRSEVSILYELDMPSKAINQYVSAYLPELSPADAELTLNFYISQSENALKNSITSTSGFEVVPYAPAANGSLYFSSMSGFAGMPLSGGTYAEPRDALRAGEVVQIAGVVLPGTAAQDILVNGLAMGSPSFVFDGLDENQSYYIYSEIEVVHKQVTNGALETAVNSPDDDTPLIRISGASGLVGVNTKGDLTAPEPGDKTPVSPKLRVQKVNGVDNIGADRATIEWDRVAAGAGERIEYEVLRLYNDPMADELISKREAFAQVWAAIPHSADDNAMYTSGNEMLRWNGSGFEPVSTDLYIYNNNYMTNILDYSDLLLTPNRIYFYYVRTVKMVGGQKSYSDWSRVTLTTKPVESPFNLQIETGRTDYDPMTQTIISFDSMVSPERVGSEYNFYYQLRKEGTAWDSPVRMSDVELRASVQPNGTGTYKYFYKLIGLEPGTSYTIRVYTTDKDGNESIYTVPVTFKTDIDQEDYDDKDQIDTWSRYLTEELQKLLKEPYWLTAATASRLEAVYRPSMFNSLLVGAPDYNITLYGTSADNAVYYIPVSAMLAAANANKGFKIVHGNMEIIIPPGMIDTAVNDVTAKANARIKDGTIADYYMRLTLNWTERSDEIYGAQRATKEVAIRLEAVESSVTAERWDRDMLELLTGEVIKLAEDAGILDDLKDMVQDGRISEDIIKFIEGIIAETVRDFASTLSSELKAVTVRTSVITAFDKPFTIVAKDTADTAVANGYQYQGSDWTQRETVSYTGGRAMYPAGAGTYVFTGRAAVVSELTGLPNSAAVTSLVFKYDLEDYLGELSWNTLERSVTKDMLAGVVARVAGAPRGAEPFDWLAKNKALTVSRRNSQSPIQAQEALYLVMSLYEFKTNTKVSSIRVTNYAFTNNMKNLEDRYKPHVRAAFEIGLTDKSLQPTGAMKVRDLLSMLGTLNNRVKL